MKKIILIAGIFVLGMATSLVLVQTQFFEEVEGKPSASILERLDDLENFQLHFEAKGNEIWPNAVFNDPNSNFRFQFNYIKIYRKKLGKLGNQTLYMYLQKIELEAVDGKFPNKLTNLKKGGNNPGKLKKLRNFLSSNDYSLSGFGHYGKHTNDGEPLEFTWFHSTNGETLGFEIKRKIPYKKGAGRWGKLKAENPHGVAFFKTITFKIE